MELGHQDHEKSTITSLEAILGVQGRESSRRPWLVSIYPTAVAGGLIELPMGPFVVGRGQDCDLILEDRDVSRRHAVFEPNGDTFIVRDLGSTNGTFVNERPVEGRLLRSGDLVRIGSHILKFLRSDHVEAQYYETIYNLMISDPLTGAFNKRYFDEALQRELVRSQRHGRPMCLVLIDIDHFKQINDNFGHLIGDDVLREFVRRAKSMVRADEVFARYGGEEFAAILDEANRVHGRNFAERLRTRIAMEPFRVGQLEIPVTVSIGLADVSGGEPITVDALIAIADANLYEAKRAGRNCTVG